MYNVRDKTLTEDTSQLLIFVSLTLPKTTNTNLCSSHAHRACGCEYSDTVAHCMNTLSQSAFHRHPKDLAEWFYCNRNQTRKPFWLAVSVFFSWNPGSEVKVKVGHCARENHQRLSVLHRVNVTANSLEPFLKIVTVYMCRKQNRQSPTMWGPIKMTRFNTLLFYKALLRMWILNTLIWKILYCIKII